MLLLVSFTLPALCYHPAIEETEQDAAVAG